MEAPRELLLKDPSCPLSIHIIFQAPIGREKQNTDKAKTKKSLLPGTKVNMLLRMGICTAVVFLEEPTIGFPKPPSFWKASTTPDLMEEDSKAS